MVRRCLAAAAALMVAGCQAGLTPAASRSAPASPRPSVPSSPVPSPPVVSQSESPSASPMPDLALTTAWFRCRLPVLTATQFDDSASMAGGFVTFPAATYQADPAGGIQSRPTGDFVATGNPTLVGIPQSGPPFYDLALKRWLPVGSDQTSPDGTAYAYAAAGPRSADPTQIHVVSVATAADHVIPVLPPAPGAATGWEVADFDGTNVFILSTQMETYPMGVWRVRVADGSVQQLTATAAIYLVREGKVWFGRDDPRDPAPPRPPRSGSVYDSLASIDLSTGAETDWVYSAGKAVALLGVDRSGDPVVSVAGGPDFDTSHGLIEVVSSAGGPATVVSDGRVLLTSLQNDVGRLWFGNDRGIYVWTASTGVRKVFGLSPAMIPSGSLGTSVGAAGYCI